MQYEIYKHAKSSLISGINFHPGIAKYYGFFGYGLRPVFVGEVQCKGLEESLLECENNGLGLSTCGHYLDAGVVCQGLHII